MLANPTAPDAPLPILARRDEIEQAVRSHQVVVVCGETGSGKTTQLPRIVLDLARDAAAPARRPGLIGHTQPRRLAARSVAARIAEEVGEPLGGTVGVKVRFSDQTSARTRIKVMTDGILLAELMSDPDLRAYSTIILDEAHERSLNIDFLLGYLRELLPRRRDLKLIITSATIDPGRFSRYFAADSGTGAPIIEVSGRAYPIEVRYRGADRADDAAAEIDYEGVADAVEELLSARTGGAGDVLAFLPGEREIRLSRDAITRRRLDVLTLPLLSRLTDQEQDLIFHPAPGGRRRVVLATNIAETSLTVPGIRHVIDTGLARISRYDAARKVQRLPVEPISRASANQRTGRCGRLGPGVCIRLFSEASYHARPAFTEPGIRRTSLASVILHMKSLGGRLAPIERFAFLDPPDAAAIRDGYETLFELGAIAPGQAGSEPGREADWAGSRLTDIGRRLARMPVDPRVGRLLLASQQEGTRAEAIILAAVLSIQDPRERPLGKQDDADRAQAVFRHPESDFLTLLNIWDQYTHEEATRPRSELAAWCRDRFVSAARMREWAETARQLRAMTRDLDDSLPVPEADALDQDDDADAGPAATRSGQPRERDDAIHRTLLTGLISHVACREVAGAGPGGAGSGRGGAASFDYRGVRNNVVHLFPGSVLFKKGPKWIMAAEIVQTTRLYARTVARIEPEWIEELAGHMFRSQLSDPHLDTSTGHACAWERVMLSSIVVVPRRQTRLAATDPAAARSIFLLEALARARWELDVPFMRHNREIKRRVQEVEARLRRHGAMVPDDELAAWFDARVPREICTPETFQEWRQRAELADPELLHLSAHQVVRAEFRPGMDDRAYPDAIHTDPAGIGALGTLEYALAPGKDEDGITVSVALDDLDRISEDRLAWLVPGSAPALVLGLLKTLPKPQRARLEQGQDLSQVADAIAAAVSFGQESPERAIAEAADVLYAVKLSDAEFQRRALPTYLRVRVRVLDEAGRSLGVDRDVSALRSRFAARLNKARAARVPDLAEQHGITDWTFGDLPGSVSPGSGAPPEPDCHGVPALKDAGVSVSLVRMPSADEARSHTILGVRRLLALRCREELSYAIEGLGTWRELVEGYQALGSAAELRDAMTLLIASRAFLDARPTPRTREEFEERLLAGSPRLHAAARDVADVIAPVLEHRQRVSQRLSGGTPRLWAESVADIREQAAYLMPRGFLTLVPWERLRRYPRYAESMRTRLFSLRDEGMKASLEVLHAFAPHWKRLTGRVAAMMSQARDDAEHQPATKASVPQRKTAAPLPQARRAAPIVNVDAGEWAMQPGRLGAPLEAYRWSLEELRVAMVTPALAGSDAPTVKHVEALWAATQNTGPQEPHARHKPRR